jgi:hypothetical protein
LRNLIWFMKQDKKPIDKAKKITLERDRDRDKPRKKTRNVIWTISMARHRHCKNKQLSKKSRKKKKIWNLMQHKITFLSPDMFQFYSAIRGGCKLSPFGKILKSKMFRKQFNLRTYVYLFDRLRRHAGNINNF